MSSLHEVRISIWTSRPSKVAALEAQRFVQAIAMSASSTVNASDVQISVPVPTRPPLRTGQPCKSPGCHGQLVVKDSRRKRPGSEWYRKVYHCNSCGLVHGSEEVHESEIRGHGSISRS